MLERKWPRGEKYDRANDMLYIEGRLHAPYFIFIKCARRYSDAERLQKLGVDSYQKLEPQQRAKSCLYLTEDSEWAHLMDDWLYTL